MVLATGYSLEEAEKVRLIFPHHAIVMHVMEGTPWETTLMVLRLAMQNHRLRNVYLEEIHEIRSDW